jgi:uncharacterized protein (DUF952 family)
MLFKLVKKSEYKAGEKEWRGSPLDREDGFLHFSTAAQLKDTAARFFKGVADAQLLICRQSSFGDELVFEKAASKGREGLFPHLYGALRPEHVLRVIDCPLDKQGYIILPTKLGEVASPPSPLSSGAPSPPSMDEDECETPPSPSNSPPSRAVCEDPPVVPAPVVAAAESSAGPERGPFAPQNVKGAPLSELLLCSWALVQTILFLVVEVDSFTTVCGLGLVGALCAGWLFLGLLSVVKCPVQYLSKFVLCLGVGSCLFVSKFLAFWLVVSGAAVVALLAMPFWMLGSLDMLFLFFQRHKANRA